MPREEDRPLIEQLATGEPGAIRWFVEAHRAAVFAFALRLSGNATLAEDILQETFLAALRGISGYRGEGSLKAWVLTIARREALAQVRRNQDTPTEEESLEFLGATAGWGAPSPEESLGDQQRQVLVEAALARLAPTDREVLLLRDIEGLSGEETAAALGVPLAAMKSRLHRARLRLVAALHPDTTEDDHGGS